MTRKLFILGIGLILLVAAALTILIFLPKGKTISRNENTLEHFYQLENFSNLMTVFNADSGTVRIIAILSPSDPMSERGFHILQDVYNEMDSDKVMLYIIWSPVFNQDTPEMAEEKSIKFVGKRVRYFWDPDRIVSVMWKEVLGFDQPIWDIYLVYEPSVKWKLDPAPPQFWMRQLSGLVDAPILNKGQLLARVKEMVPEAAQFADTTRVQLR
ncbi:MAG: hypothetical protein D6748_06410 [Calditrichaeota bacterium]|nr:MAG: hypothetical protein D6748_06410 [Calditrichota bacterium]